jgi:hypothetical protein
VDKNTSFVTLLGYERLRNPNAIIDSTSLNEDFSSLAYSPSLRKLQSSHVDRELTCLAIGLLAQSCHYTLEGNCRLRPKDNLGWLMVFELFHLSFIDPGGNPKFVEGD